MDIAAIPLGLKALSDGGSAMKSITAWWNQSKGDSRTLIGELKDNLSYLDMVACDGVLLSDVVEKLSATEYKRLLKEGYNFNKLKKSRIMDYPSLRGSDLESWAGKETEELVVSIYDKVNDIKIRFPHVGNNAKYRWSVRVSNIRKRVWLLLLHIRS